jgi:AcrR family transcriptional regulator
LDAAKREAILDAATHAFARHGFKKASIDEIARAAGVAKGTVYLACETKEDLFYQVVHREVRAWTADVAKLVDPRVPADQLLMQCGLASRAYLHKRPLVRDLVFGSHQLLLPEWADRLDQLRELGRVNAREILTLGVRQGLFRSDLDLNEIAAIMEDVLIATHAFYDRGKGREERVMNRMRTAFELLLNGLRKPERGR